MSILFYYDDHDPPHFRVKAAGFKAKFDLVDLSVSEVSGQIRPQDVARIRQWAQAHRLGLYDAWNRARRREPLARIED